MADSLKSTLTRLKLAPGDVLLVRVHPSEDHLEIGRRLQQELKDRGIDNLMMVAHEGSSVESLDPDMMAKHGWYRKATKIKTTEPE